MQFGEFVRQHSTFLYFTFPILSVKDNFWFDPFTVKATTAQTSPARFEKIPSRKKKGLGGLDDQAGLERRDFIAVLLVHCNRRTRSIQLNLNLTKLGQVLTWSRSVVGAFSVSVPVSIPVFDPGLDPGLDHDRGHASSFSSFSFDDHPHPPLAFASFSFSS